ncbi:protein eva-1 homolog C isoform X2 [Sturnira hondurensis]|uniref:protein eva-1 homolog C isoform X2 n=1 Tax=Sturnira hondurensis TaxID=192404 RepID=UPI00187A6CC7|nr:protein eva-1 homolog C isoform X2 [Sturnira hondurensis]
MLLPGPARPPPAPQPAQHPGLRRQVEPPGRLLRLLCCTVLVCSREITALSDFSGKKRPPSRCALARPGYLTKLLQNHTAYACDGDRLDLQCPRHSTISVQSAFYGHNYRACSAQQPTARGEDHSACVAPTTLQVLDECQNQRACHLLVNSRVFGPDLCPGSSKYLLVSFKCQPNELKNKTVCEDQELKLHCHESKFLNIYSATYGRRARDWDLCTSGAQRLPPFDCLSYSAVHVLSQRCYGRQRCKVLVNNQHFGSPCLPGVRQRLAVTYACVPKHILTAIDPAVANPKPSVKQEDSDHDMASVPPKYKKCAWRGDTWGGTRKRKSCLDSLRAQRCEGRPQRVEGSKERRGHRQQLSGSVCLHQSPPRESRPAVRVQRLHRPGPRAVRLGPQGALRQGLAGAAAGAGAPGAGRRRGLGGQRGRRPRAGLFRLGFPRGAAGVGQDSTPRLRVRRGGGAGGED